MTFSSRVFLFGDQTVDPYPIIKQLSQQSVESPTLRTFLQCSTDALHQELSDSRSFDRSAFPSFNSIPALAEAYSQEDRLEEAISTVLLCVAQLGLLLREVHGDSLSKAGYSKTYLVGLCTGLLPAAALATTTSTSRLLRLAPQIVRLSLRIGLAASRRSALIERSSESWSTIVSGVAPSEQQKIIDQFHRKNAVSTSKKAYVSAEAENSATISAPPSTLASLFSSSDLFRNARKIKLPISAAFHAAHLGSPNYDEILGSRTDFSEYRVRDDIQLIHTSTGKPILASNLDDLLPQIISEILQKPQRWSLVVQGMVSALEGQSVQISSVGPVRAADSLRRELTKHDIDVQECTEMRAGDDGESLQGRSSDVAIIGFASRMPESETLEEIWEILEKGRDTHKKIPQDRFDVGTHCDPSGKIKNTTITPYGCFLDRPGHFDARLFNMSPREAAQTDPAQRLLLLTTYEALEMAGYSPNGSPSYAGERIGTFFGQTLDDYREANASQDIEMYYVTGGIRAFGPGRLNYHFKWEGPSYCVDAACSSSALSIQMAVASLRSHECDTAVAGGTNTLTGSDMYSGLSRGSFLSPTGSCKTFDNDADGYCRGEGVGTVILKRLDDAIAEGDNIQAVIKSAATNHSAYASSITHPHAGAQQKLMRQVLQDAHLEPEQIDYVEMHGTGTQAGDATEFTSVTNVLSNRSQDNPLRVGAVKANVGHAEAAAGTNSLTKILMMMRKNAIPPHVGIKGRINEKFPPLEQVNVQINRSIAPFHPRAGADGKRRVLLNNFNATGGNTSLVIEDAPRETEGGQDPRTTHVVAVSGKTAYSFRENIQKLLQFLEKHPNTSLQDLAYTTTARRIHHSFRKAYAVSSLDQLMLAMRKDTATTADPTSVNPTKSTIFAFTGQGAQYVGMGQRLFETSSTFKKCILECESICLRQGLPSFVGILTSNAPGMQDVRPTQSQLALVSIAIALSTLWQSWGITPTGVIGHSLGEYAALCVAGVLSVSDTLYLVGMRAETMETLCIANSHAMLAVQSGPEPLRQIISTSNVQSCEIACFNGPKSTVISGDIEDLDVLEEKLAAAGLKKTLLELPFAFHSVQMDPILDDIRAISRNVEFSKPSIPVASTLLGSLVEDKDVITPDYLARQARQPVQFQKALEACKARGITDDKTVWIEMGAHPLCLGMVRSTLGVGPTKALPSLKRDEDAWATLSRSVATAYESGVEVSWTEYHRDFRHALKLLELPTYAFDLKKYWLNYEGDWLLTKNSAPSTASAPKQQPTFSTTCLQHVESESFSNDGASVVFTSQLGEPKLNTAVRGHLVNGVGLCPSSVYADVAFTAAWYIASRTSSADSIPAMNLSTMQVHRPLVVDAGETAQALRVTATRSGNDLVKISISSKDSNGVREHVNCTVIFGNGEEWIGDWRRSAYLVQSRMEGLTQSAKAHRLLKDMIYKQFQTVVNYIKPYHTIDKLFMDCDLNESVANIRFQPMAEHGDFLYSPYWIDTVAHLGGFILNANVNTPTDTVFISHGWDSFRIAAPLSDTKSYRGYVRMQPQGNKGVMAGDMYIFDGDVIVVLCTGLKFQRMKRSILHSLLGTSHQSSPAPAPQLTKQRAPPVMAAKAEVHNSTTSPHGAFSGVLATIGAEVGVDVSDLVDGAKISDLGVDSLLTISILGRLRTETNLDLPSSLFVTYPTVAELRTFFDSKMTSAPQSSIDDSDSSDSTYTMDSDSTTRASSAFSTPEEAEAPDSVAVLLSIIAHEVGVKPAEILPSTPFAEIGVDSLLTISILDAFKRQLGMSLPAMFFQQNPTLEAVQKAIGTPKPIPVQEPVHPVKQNSPSHQPFRSKSVLLQGRPRPDRPALFLLPDGAGSLFSYISLPSLPSGVAVYGLDSPFHNSPANYTLSFSEVAAIYINAIREIQPKGPYMLGGWSLGGIHAYETTRQLVEAGEHVTHLLMIDSPCPGTLPPLPSPTLHLLEKAGIFDGLSSSGGPITERTRLHFLNSVRALEHYTVTPLPTGTQPDKVTVIWAQDGVMEGRDNAGEDVLAGATDDDESKAADMNKAKMWLTGKRESFGPSGWEKLTGMGDKVECHVVGGNHFSIMFPPKIEAVAKALARGLPA